ncbi:MAG: 3-deoxy-D-manno-octulosonic acid transferase, partial [Deltaproteobacteria bacterium]|nr:3-deoxy-D-manno-octulosonic acid transferase [Deltaproteobacteria bacterium]
MKYVIYDILLNILIILLSPYFILKMITARKYRAGIPERFGFINREKAAKLRGGPPVVWFHAVSVGETKAALPLIRLFKESRPSARVIFSTVTSTGNRVAREDGAGLIDTLIYLPLDLSWTIKRVIRQLRPDAFIVVEKEFWPNIYRRLNAEGVPIIVVNGTVSERSFRRFSALGFFFRDMFGMISFFSARTGEDRERAIAIGVKKERAKTLGNIKFDLRPAPAGEDTLRSLKEALGIEAKDRIIAAGSTHRGEEEMILDVFTGLSSGMDGLKLILAPRHPERFGEVEALIKKTGLPYARRTSAQGGKAARIILLDTIGELMSVYAFSTIALVGGSLVPGIGGHNLLEPAFYGKPVVYGAHLTTYLDMAKLLEAAGVGVRV